ncbi:MAG: RluA family pseudouridine synthase, partial [Clostridia bacterium]|nr:RluA family pseudouridine synthase [Clostridia bacterium]
MEIKKFQITESLQGLRIDKTLQLLLEDSSRAFVQNLFEREQVLLNDKAVKKSAKVQEGDRVEIMLPDPVLPDISAENIPLEIVYEDDEMLVVNKEKGMVVHPAPGNYSGTMVNALLYHCADRLSSINGVARPGILHRIDKDTSGLLLVAKTDHAHNFLAEQIKNHTLDRCYRAIVLGSFKENEGKIDAPIGRNPNDRKKMAINYQNGKNAVTNYKVLADFGGYSYIECVLETGRTHQIRVHMASIGHPVLNDPLYFQGNCNLKFDFEGQCLHAKKVGFIHPVSGEKMIFESELPNY